MEPNTRPTRLRPSVDPYDASCTSDLVLCDEALALFGPGEPIRSCTDEGVQLWTCLRRSSSVVVACDLSRTRLHCDNERWWPDDDESCTACWYLTHRPLLCRRFCNLLLCVDIA